MFSPFSNKRTTIIHYIIIWIAIFINHVGILVSFVDNSNIAIVDSFAYNLIYCLIGIGIWYPIQFINIDESSTGKIIQNHVITAIVTSIIWVYSGYLILSNLFVSDELYLQFLSDSIVWRFYIGIIYYSILVSLYYVIFYYRSFRTKLENEHHLQTLVKEAELKSLRYQINPHFIFNSLNSISSLTISNPEKAREMSTNLSIFLRKTLADNENQKIKLKEEIDNIKLYLEIEKVRFGERLDFIMDISDRCEALEIPNMILQPIFENAIKHGVYESIEKVTINFICKLKGESISITVSNNFDPTAVSDIGEGIGLKNIRDRLKLIYNRTDLISISEESDLFQVSLLIPVIPVLK